MSQQKMLTERQKAQIKELEEKRMQELTDALTDNIFPVGIIGDVCRFDYEVILSKALEHDKPRTLQCSPEVFIALIRKPLNELTIQMVGYACNCIENKTSIELGVSNEVHADILEDIAVLGAKWKALCDEYHTPINERYKKLEGRVIRNESIIIPNTSIIT